MRPMPLAFAATLVLAARRLQLHADARSTAAAEPKRRLQQRRRPPSHNAGRHAAAHGERMQRHRRAEFVGQEASPRSRSSGAPGRRRADRAHAQARTSRSRWITAAIA